MGVCGYVKSRTVIVHYWLAVGVLRITKDGKPTATRYLGADPRSPGASGCLAPSQSVAVRSRRSACARSTTSASGSLGPPSWSGRSALWIPAKRCCSEKTSVASIGRDGTSSATRSPSANAPSTDAPGLHRQEREAGASCTTPDGLSMAMSEALPLLSSSHRIRREMAANGAPHAMPSFRSPTFIATRLRPTGMPACAAIAERTCALQSPTESTPRRTDSC
jgi:hypothetical protein